MEGLRRTTKFSIGINSFQTVIWTLTTWLWSSITYSLDTSVPYCDVVAARVTIFNPIFKGLHHVYLKLLDEVLGYGSTISPHFFRKTRFETLKWDQCLINTNQNYIRWATFIETTNIRLSLHFLSSFRVKHATKSSQYMFVFSTLCIQPVKNIKYSSRKCVRNENCIILCVDLLLLLMYQ
jgi:hypothetical protein